MTCLCAGVRGSSLLFGSGDGGVGDGDANPATQECITNDGRNATTFLPLFPASCPLCVFPLFKAFFRAHRLPPSITSVGGTINVPEVAVFFSGGGFSNYASHAILRHFLRQVMTIIS